jgi:hypothetical protein
LAERPSCKRQVSGSNPLTGSHVVTLWVRFRLRASAPRRVFWQLLQRGRADLCVKDPGFETDLDVDADLEAMTQAYLGHLPPGRRDPRFGSLLLGPRDPGYEQARRVWNGLIDVHPAPPVCRPPPRPETALSPAARAAGAFGAPTAGKPILTPAKSPASTTAHLGTESGGNGVIGERQ